MKADFHLDRKGLQKAVLIYFLLKHIGRGYCDETNVYSLVKNT